MLESLGFCRYDFRRCAPGEYAVRLEMLEDWPCSQKGQSYIAFVEETGAKYVGRMIRWVYFAKKVTDGPFDLDSRLAHVKAVSRLILLVLIMEGCALLRALTTLVQWPEAETIGMVAVMAAITGLMAYGLLRMHKLRKALQAERQLHE